MELSQNDQNVLEARKLWADAKPELEAAGLTVEPLELGRIYMVQLPDGSAAYAYCTCDVFAEEWRIRYNTNTADDILVTLPLKGDHVTLAKKQIEAIKKYQIKSGW